MLILLKLSFFDMLLWFLFPTASPMHDQVEINMLALTGRMLRLECPFQLGLANGSIHPYHHVWLNDRQMDLEIPNSGRRKTFYVNVNETSRNSYSCAIRMRRCSECTNVQFLPSSSDRVEFIITKAGECLHLICVYVPHTLCHLVQSLFPW